MSQRLTLSHHHLQVYLLNNPSAALSATASTAAVVDLQSQLRDTQSSLASHLDKVRALEGVLAEQEAMKREVRTLREMIELERVGAENAYLVHQHTHEDKNAAEMYM
jgi:hypothetical protein